MFKLIELVLYGEEEGQVFPYHFTEGINYFKGKNDSGKTEFYTFLDYMFGANINLSDKEWFRGTLSSAQLFFYIMTGSLLLPDQFQILIRIILDILMKKGLKKLG